MGAEDDRMNGAGFELAGLPQPMAVRDPDTGQVVDGYRLTVKSLKTGATAEIEIPKSRYSVEYVRLQAEAHLAPLDATVAAFGNAGMSGASSPASG